MKKYCCAEWDKNIDSLNAPIILQSIRAGYNTHHCEIFAFCPWCGKTLQEQVEFESFNDGEHEKLETNEKVTCEVCTWHGVLADLLHSSNPFDEGDTLAFCPECKSCGGIFIPACSEPGCWADTTCGTLTAEGYRSTCDKHFPG